MKREIKFRGKDLFHSDYVLAKWVYGGIMIDGDDAWLCAKVEKKGIISLKVDPETVGQYIGIKDCNGREVYEGDIVEIKIGYCGNPRYHESTYQDVVRYNEKLCAYTPLDSADIYSVNVIGNIHDNPELLK